MCYRGTYMAVVPSLNRMRIDGSFASKHSGRMAWSQNWVNTELLSRNYSIRYFIILLFLWYILFVAFVPFLHFVLLTPNGRVSFFPTFGTASLHLYILISSYFSVVHFRDFLFCFRPLGLATYFWIQVFVVRHVFSSLVLFMWSLVIGSYIILFYDFYTA